MNILKWILIILFFPISLIFVGYYKQHVTKKEYRKQNANTKYT
jgi:preprotein translocase subunit SecG